MTSPVSSSRRFQFRERYFYLLVLPIALSIEWAVAASFDWSDFPRGEWIALADLCVIIPLVYFAFFSSSLEMKARLIRTAGLVGLGLFAVRYIVPEPNQVITVYLTQVRNALLVFVILFEGWVLYKLLRATFGNNADAKTLERDFAMPAWIAKLLVLETRFWKAVWSFFRRK